MSNQNEADELMQKIRQLKINEPRDPVATKVSTKGLNPASVNPPHLGANASRLTPTLVQTRIQYNNPSPEQDYVMVFWLHLQNLVNKFIHRVKLFLAPFQRREVSQACNSTALLGVYWLFFVTILFFLYYFRTQIQQWAPIYVWLSFLFMFTNLSAHYLLRLKWYYVVIINMGLIFVIHSIDYNTDNYLTNLDSQLGNAMFYHRLSHKLAADDSNAELTILNAVASLLKVTHACLSKGVTVNNEQCHEELKLSSELVNKYLVDIHAVMSDQSVVKPDYKVSVGSMGNYQVPTYVSKENIDSAFQLTPVDKIQLKSKQHLILLAMSRLLDGNRYERTVENIARNTWYSFITASLPFNLLDWLLKFGQMWSSQQSKFMQLLSIGRLGLEGLSVALDYAFPTQHRYRQIVHKFHPDVVHDASHIWNTCGSGTSFCRKSPSGLSVPLTDYALEARLQTPSRHIPPAHDKCPDLSDIADVDNTHIEMVDCVDFKKLCLQGMDRHNQFYEQQICPQACKSDFEVKTKCECNNTKEYCLDRYPVACNNTKEYCLDKYPAACNETVVNTSKSQSNFTCSVVNDTASNFSRIPQNESTCPNPSCSLLNGSAWVECHLMETRTFVNTYVFTLMSTIMPLMFRRR